jgi:inner membrane transporter RhtA
MPATDARICRASSPGPVARTVARMPPTSFLISAVFHYLGPSLAVLLFAHVAAPGVAWLRIASAAVVFALWRRPWRILTAARTGQRLVFTGLGIVLAAMNLLFYLAIDRLPLATVGAIEFLGTVILAAIGARTRRNALALALAIGGVAILTSVQAAGQPLGYLFAFANCAGFMLYILLGHRVANTALGGGSRELPLSGIDQLGLAMIIAAAAAAPFGFVPAAPAFTHPAWLMCGIGVGVCSSVIPYVTDQLAMARLPRATFSLMLALLPAAAAVIGLIVLGQVPTMRDLAGIGLVILGVALHRDPPRTRSRMSGRRWRGMRGSGLQTAHYRQNTGLAEAGLHHTGCRTPGGIQMRKLPDRMWELPRHEDDEAAEDEGIGRILALSDGVFAIAITLLIITMQARPARATPTCRKCCWRCGRATWPMS